MIIGVYNGVMAKANCHLNMTIKLTEECRQLLLKAQREHYLATDHYLAFSCLIRKAIRGFYKKPPEKQESTTE